MLGQLQDAGNAGGVARQRASSPKLQVFNTALITAQSGVTLPQARRDRAFWGRLVESAIGAHLANAAAVADCAVSTRWSVRQASLNTLAVIQRSNPDFKRRRWSCGPRPRTYGKPLL